MTRIFPRFSPADEKRLLDEIAQDVRAGREASTLRENGLHPLRQWPATGGEPATEAELREIRRDLVSRLDALDAHAPADQGARVRAMDRAITDGLMATLGDDSGALFQPGVWTYLSMVLLPDVVLRRFGRFERDRFVGNRRNTFSRLYLRGLIFGGFLDQEGVELLEDDFVGLVDRTLAGDHRLTRALAVATVQRPPGMPHRNFVRSLLEEAAREAVVTELGLLDETGLQLAVAEMIERIGSSAR